jgi:hypothetical protein
MRTCVKSSKWIQVRTFSERSCVARDCALKDKAFGSLAGPVDGSLDFFSMASEILRSPAISSGAIAINIVVEGRQGAMRETAVRGWGTFGAEIRCKRQIWA